MPQRSRPKPFRKNKPAFRPARREGADDHTSQRLQKVLAAAGLGSRRQCEELITTGRVEVDRKVVTELGTKVDPMQQEIRVDGTPLSKPKLLHYMVHKPAGVVTSNRDPEGRPRVIDLVPSDVRLFPVGRLDMYSEGLILVTNDGELANLLAHPRYGVEKIYHVLVAGTPQAEVLERLRQGVHLAEGFAHAARVTVKKNLKNSAILEMVLDEGRNREIRRLLARVGHKVLRLKRIALGPLRLGELPPGEYRPLHRDEVRLLRAAALSKKPSKGPNAGNTQLVAPDEAEHNFDDATPTQPPQRRPDRPGGPKPPRFNARPQGAATKSHRKQRPYGRPGTAKTHSKQSQIAERPGSAKKQDRVKPSRPSGAPVKGAKGRRGSSTRVIIDRRGKQR